MYDLFCTTGEPDTGSSSINRLNENHTKIWHYKTDSLDFTHTSRQAWNTIQNLGVNPKKPEKKSYPVSADDIAAKLLENSKADLNKNREKKIYRELHRKSKSLNPNWNYSKKFTLRELQIG